MIHLMRLTSLLQLCLATLAVVACSCTQRLTHAEAWVIAAHSHDLAPADARLFKDQLQQKPDDPELLARLAGYYYGRAHRIRQPETPEERTERIALSHWIAEHAPTSDAASLVEIVPDPLTEADDFQAVKVIWTRQVRSHPSDPAILRNAGLFVVSDDPAAAVSWWSRIGLPVPEKPRREHPKLLQNLGRRIGAFFKHDRASAPTQRDCTADPAPEDPEKRFFFLECLASDAFRLHKDEQAAKAAHDLLDMAPQFSKNWNYGNAIFSGHEVLGGLALRRGDLSTARAELRSAADTPGSPQLDSFGPDLGFPILMLARGERVPVLSFLRRSARFWDTHTCTINVYSQRLLRGESVDLYRDEFNNPEQLRCF